MLFSFINEMFNFCIDNAGKPIMDKCFFIYFFLSSLRKIVVREEDSSLPLEISVFLWFFYNRKSIHNGNWGCSFFICGGSKFVNIAYAYIYIYIYIYTHDQQFGTTLNCFSKHIIKANFVIDRKVRSDPSKNKQVLFYTFTNRWESLLRTFSSY